MPFPFCEKSFTLYQPDGKPLKAIGWGNQFHAVFETEDGYTLVKRSDTGFWEYAKLSAEGDQLLPCGVQAGTSRFDPKSFGLEKHLRVNDKAARKDVQRHKGKFNFNWEKRIKESKKQLKYKIKAIELGAPNVIVPAPPQITTTGQVKGLTLLIDFPDMRGTISRDEVESFCNTEGYNGFGNNGSVRDYFYDNSNGRLTFTNKVLPWFTARYPRSYYTDRRINYPDRAQQLIKEALTHWKAQSEPLDDLTLDADGNVRALSVFYAGEATNNWSEGLWPHAFSFSPAFVMNNGIKIHDYQITDMSSELTLGTFCHENAHMVCDFPDLYDYAYDGISSGGVGVYCLMCAGGNLSPKNPVHVCAYLKYRAGWIDIQNIDRPGSYTISSNQLGIFVKERAKNEYYIIEKRTKQHRDSALPNTGLAVWHVDEFGNQEYQNRQPHKHYECSLVQADGRFDLEDNRNYGDQGDLFQPGQRFGRNTSPKSMWWDGQYSGLEIKNIAPVGDSFVVDVSSAGPPAPEVIPEGKLAEAAVKAPPTPISE